MNSMNACDWRSDNAVGTESLTQALGRAAFESGMHGIIVPSAVRRRFRNLNVFPSRLDADSRLMILSADKLPPPPGGGAT